MIQSQPNRPPVSKSLLTFYYHATFFLASALLGMHTILSLVSGSGMEAGPILLGTEGALALLAMIGSEMERGRSRTKPPSGVFLTVLGLLQIALCVWTGGISSPYFLLVGSTTVFAGMALSTAKTTYVTSVLAYAYVIGVWFVAEEGVPRGWAEKFTAVLVHVAFLVLAAVLSSRVARSQRREVEVLSGQSMTDPLTSLDNRRAFLKKMESELLRAERFSWPITMLILDLDHFKKMNDEYGHASGDAVLVEVGRLLVDTVGPVDHIARVGGEEFAVAAVAAEPHYGRDLADRIVRAFRARNWSKVKPGLKVTVSVGVAVLPPGYHSAEPTNVLREIMERADRALYHVKQHGRDNFHVSSEDSYSATPSATGTGTS